MNRRRSLIRLSIAAISLAFASLATSQESLDDPGKAQIGKVSVTVYYATNGDAKIAGTKTLDVDQETQQRLRGEERLRFKEYRMLGQDAQPLLRSYENWAQPLKPSDEVLIRFMAKSRPTKKATGLDLELWLSRKKVLKTDAVLEGDRPLFILGPQWRGGRLIIAVALAPDGKRGS